MKNHRGSEHAELEKLQDGAIIGDGRSDSILETKSYTLKHNNQSFVLLDVPGIESDEKKVKQQISNATKKPMLFFMLQKHLLLRKKEKREKRELLKRSKSNLIHKQRYIPYTISRLTAQEP
ncbi:GTPase [Helicobacter pylori]